MRATLAFALLAAGCSFTPDVSSHRPKLAADCPGQKACGDRCVDQDDPVAGCGPVSCLPCPGAPANAVPICGAGATCGFACLPGFADCDGDPSSGCEKDVTADDASCGACGHACAGCAGGLCPVATVATTGTSPRGIAVQDALAWGEEASGSLFTSSLTGQPLQSWNGFGSVSWVRTAGKSFAVAGTETLLGGGVNGTVWICTSGQTAGAKSLTSTQPEIVGLDANEFYVAHIADPQTVGYRAIVSPYFQDTVPFTEPIHSVVRGAGGWFAGADTGLRRFTIQGIVEPVVPFAGLARAPHPDRLAAAGGPLSADPALTKPVDFVFADLSDGSVWHGRTSGTPTELPYRLVHGDGPRTQ
ncbi:MAG TPA: hypothetical protein VFP50_12965, partial [Anaeromyxobacteraceae bacterium]|nr:hypothetical protein [Anaeromyxobacteraceae bacterium]